MRQFAERVVATVIGGLIILAINYGLRSTPVDTTERAYYMYFGGIWCARREITPCGVRLSDCADSNIYECMNNVHWEEE